MTTSPGDLEILRVQLKRELLRAILHAEALEGALADAQKKMAEQGA